VLAPTPAGLIDGAPELHARDRDHFEAPIGNSRVSSG
jgi:hypothetical protein